MASLIKDEFMVNGRKRSLVLFSNPNSKFRRERMTIRASLDDGNSWPVDHRLLLDEGEGRGYSCMTKIDDSTVGILPSKCFVKDLFLAGVLAFMLSNMPLFKTPKILQS